MSWGGPTIDLTLHMCHMCTTRPTRAMSSSQSHNLTVA
jgi:hypothetical protein